MHYGVESDGSVVRFPAQEDYLWSVQDKYGESDKRWRQKRERQPRLHNTCMRWYDLRNDICVIALLSTRKLCPTCT